MIKISRLSDFATVIMQCLAEHAAQPFMVNNPHMKVNNSHTNTSDSCAINTTNGQHLNRLDQRATTNDHHLSAKAISARSGIPLPTVSKLLKLLADADLLRSVQGARGGYQLARPADQISVLSILSAIDGPPALTQCNQQGEEVTCQLQGACQLRSAWHQVNTLMNQLLATLRLTDMMVASSIPLPIVIDRSINGSINGSINRSMKESMGGSIDRSVDRSIDRPADQLNVMNDIT